MPKVTLKDVAAKAGVSYQTVSKVLNGQVQVTAATEQRIWQAAETLHYQPNVAARNLRTQASNLIGFAWAVTPYSAWQPILDQFTHNVMLTIEQHGYLTVFFGDKTVDNYADTSLLAELHGQNQVAGFILANIIEDDPRVAFLQKLQVPFVAFGRSNDAWDFHWVDVDGYHGIRTAVAHLVELGHKRIAYIGWLTGYKTGQHREEGYLQGLAEANLCRGSSWLFRGNDSSQTGEQGISQFLNLPAHRRPTAVVCASDLVAVGALNGIVAAGLQVGQDMALTGYDNVPMSELLSPPLTTLRQPVQQAGQIAVELLLKQINNQPIEQKGVLLPPKLVARASTLGTMGMSVS